VPELRLNERLLVTAAQVHPDLIKAREALEAHVWRLATHRAQSGLSLTRPAVFVDEDGWLKTYRSLTATLARIERSIFAARGLVDPEPLGAMTNSARVRTGSPSRWASRFSASVL